MKLSEVIARWEGWSLAVPLPGLALNEPRLSPGKEVEDINDKAADVAKYITPLDVPFKLNVFPVLSKGTLPKLRFGQRYKLKLRTVDMAGNSVPYDAGPEDKNDAVVSNICYRRYEPVDVPALLKTESYSDGESAEVLVICSNEDVPATEYTNNVAQTNPGIATPYKNTCHRYVKPPRAAVNTAINHRMLDNAIGFTRYRREGIGKCNI